MASMSKNRWAWGFLPLVIFLVGCPKKKPLSPEVPPEPVAANEPAPVEEAQVPIPVDEGPALEIGSSEWLTVPSLEAVLFPFVSAELRPDARESLKRNASVLKVLLKESPAVQVRVEGHCDERGTLEYNLALGQRRANALRDYYLSLGVPKAGLDTISYGEERPVCSQHDEGCWVKNRRGETTLKSSGGTVRIPLGRLSAPRR